MHFHHVYAIYLCLLLSSFLPFFPLPSKRLHSSNLLFFNILCFWKADFPFFKGFSYNSLNHTTSGSRLINTRYVFRRAHRGDPDPLQRSRVLQPIPNPLPLPIQQPLRLRARTHLLLAILWQRTPTTARALAKLHLQQHD